MRREREKTGEPICKKSRLTQRSWALPHGSIRHSPSVVSSALVLMPPGRQRTGVQVGDGGGLWDEKDSVLGDVAPVTGPRRAVTHCDRACTNAQRPNLATPHNLQVLRYPDRCSLSATTAAALSSSPPSVCAGSAPRPTHTTPTDRSLSRLHLQTKSGEPSSLHQPTPRTLLRAMLPASLTQSRLLRG